METVIDVLENKHRGINENDELLKYFSKDEAAKAASFHNSIPGYKPTPLIDLKLLAEELNLRGIWLKDESKRFDLNAFKVLGACYAAAKYFKEYLSLTGDLTFEMFNNAEVRKTLKDITIVTATDGNHGRGAAWTAKQIGCKAVIYMPKNTVPARYNNIKALGADVTIINGSYDEASYLARENAAKFGWLLLQDKDHPGYETIPLWIMQGYLTLLEEIFDIQNCEKPTHVFLQSGVGSMPAAVAAGLINRFAERNIIISVVEPLDAACFYESALDSEGKPASLTNEMHTIMAGLACGTPSTSAWEILKKYSSYFIKCSDDVTVTGMKLLAERKYYKEKIVSGESGAVTTGLLYKLMKHFPDKAERLGLDKHSKVLLISTEGDTDPEGYTKLISTH